MNNKHTQDFYLKDHLVTSEVAELVQHIDKAVALQEVYAMQPQARGVENTLTCKLTIEDENAARLFNAFLSSFYQDARNRWRKQTDYVDVYMHISNNYEGAYSWAYTTDGETGKNGKVALCYRNACATSLNIGITTRTSGLALAELCASKAQGKIVADFVTQMLVRRVENSLHDKEKQNAKS